MTDDPDRLRVTLLGALAAHGWRLLPTARDLGVHESWLRRAVARDPQIAAQYAANRPPRGRPARLVMP